MGDIWTNSMTTMGYNSATPLKRYAQRVLYYDFPSKSHDYGRVLMWKPGCGLLGLLTHNLYHFLCRNSKIWKIQNSRPWPWRHFVGVGRPRGAFCPWKHRVQANVRSCAKLSWIKTTNKYGFNGLYNHFPKKGKKRSSTTQLHLHAFAGQDVVFFRPS